MRRRQEKLQAILEKTAALEEENARLSAFIRRLQKEDSTLIERLAREELKMIKEGDIVILEEKQQPNASKEGD